MQIISKNNNNNNLDNPTTYKISATKFHHTSKSCFLKNKKGKLIQLLMKEKKKINQTNKQKQRKNNENMNFYIHFLADKAKQIFSP